MWMALVEPTPPVALESRHLFSMTLEVAVSGFRSAIDRMGVEQYMGTITGGSFEGERLRGAVLPDGAVRGRWRSERVKEFDVSVMLQTHDRHPVMMSWSGITRGSPGVLADLNAGLKLDDDRYYTRTTPRFDTGAEAYAWLNDLICVARTVRHGGRLVHHVFEIL